jgi:predicted AAA+ superfamily ATPase
MSYGRHRAIKYIAAGLAALGVLLIGLSTDDKSALVRARWLAAVSTNEHQTDLS